MGLAIGDALAASIEFEPPGTFVEVTDFRAGGPHGLAAGEWTDDTSMALALADSIAEVGWDLYDQAARYVSWWRTGAPRRGGLSRGSVARGKSWRRCRHDRSGVRSVGRRLLGRARHSHRVARQSGRTRID